MQFKKIIVTSFLLSFSILFSQEKDSITKKDYGRVYGGFESNAQWYLNDKEIGTIQPEDPVRSNSYLFFSFLTITDMSFHRGQ